MKSKLYNVKVYHKPTKRVVQIRTVLSTSAKKAERDIYLIFRSGTIGVLDYRFTAKPKPITTMAPGGLGGATKTCV